MSKNDYLVINGKISSIRKASPDDPIYKRGFIFGIQKLRKSLNKEGQETDLETLNKEQED